MIFHNCIKCDYFEAIPLAEGKLPLLQKYICPKCKIIQYIKHSRVEVVTYAENMVEVDEKNKSIKLKEEG